MSSDQENCVESSIEENGVSFLWRIRNFTHHGKAVGERITEIFTISNQPRNKWVVQLYPSGSCEDNKENVGVFLKPHKQHTLPIVASIGIFVLDGSMTRRCNNTVELCNPVTFENYESKWGCPRFIQCIELLNPVYDLLPDNVLTIGLAIKTFSETNVQVPGEKQKYHQSIDMSELLYNESMADVVLSAEGKDVKAHKLILSARSPLFAAMFRQNFNETQVDRVEISDMSLTALKEMLRFIYTDKVDNLKENAEELFSASNKYDLESLHQLCEVSLVQSLTINNAAQILQLADLNNAEGLKETVTTFMYRNMAEVQESEAWQILKSKRSELIVEQFVERPKKKLSTYKN